MVSIEEEGRETKTRELVAELSVDLPEIVSLLRSCPFGELGAETSVVGYEP